MTNTPGKLLPFFVEDWDKLRYYFQDSVMADTHMGKLAKNMGTTWPIRGKEETPRKYTGYTYDELGELPEFYGKGNRLNLLYSILKETQSFDDPFCDMVDHFDTVAKQESEAIKSLKAFDIPADLPIELANFSEDTLNLCRTEDIYTIGQLIEFSQKSAKAVIVGGDFKNFLNALNHLDFTTLKHFLPIRKGTTGLFLAESIGLFARKLEDNKAASLLKAFQISTQKPAWLEAKVLSKSDTLALIAELKNPMEARFALIPAQAQQLQHAIGSSEANRVRFFAPLRNPDLESLALAIAMAASDVKPRFNLLSRRLLSS